MRFAAVVVFAEGVTREQAERVLRDLAWRKVIDTKEWLSHDNPGVHEFDEEHGTPVFYIP